MFLLVWGCALSSARAQTSLGVPDVGAAIQAIRQAPDPSAAVAAYANGFAVYRNDPELHAAYVERMVDLGLPEMAYHQAQILTTLQSNNGLAWGVVAYVDARRSQMSEAISAINLAGQYAPANLFVQRTAGEIAAWYDVKADKATISGEAQAGLKRVREMLAGRPSFAEAYSTAQKAYQSQATVTSQPWRAPAVQAAPEPTVPNAPAVPAASQAPPAPQASATGVTAPVYTAPTPAYGIDYSGSYYYPDYSSGVYLDWGPAYCYDWGSGWVAPAAGWWWEPCGFWGGPDFYPWGVSFVFGDFDDFHHFHHRHFDRDGGFDADRGWGHGGGFANREHDPSRWHRGPQGHSDFFGTPAKPSVSTVQWARAASQTRALAGAAGGASDTHWWSAPAQHSSFATAGFGRHSTPAGLPADRQRASRYSGGATITDHFGTPRLIPTRHGTGAGPRSYIRERTAPVVPAPTAHAAGSRTPQAFTRSWAVPRYQGPGESAPHGSITGNRSPERFGGWQGGPRTFAAPRAFGESSLPRGIRSENSAGVRFGGARWSGGGSHVNGLSGGGFRGGGFRGGNFAGGGYHGGGRR